MASFRSTANSRPTTFNGRRNFSLPPLNIEAGAPSPTYMACPLDEKNQQLPCIIVTPSSPCHDTEFQIHYFVPEKTSARASLFSWFTGSNGEIALPVTPDANYAVSRSSSTGCSKLRWLRTLLLLAIPLFIVFHLFLLPGAETHMIDVFSSHHQASESMGHATWPESGYINDDLFTNSTSDATLPIGASAVASTENNATGTTDIDDIFPAAPASNDGSLPQH